MTEREGVGVVAAGLLVGLALAAFGARRIAGLLYGVDALDPIAFSGAVVKLLAVAWVAA